MSNTLKSQSTDEEADLLDEIVMERPQATKARVKRKITKKRSPWNVKVLKVFEKQHPRTRARENNNESKLKNIEIPKSMAKKVFESVVTDVQEEPDYFTISVVEDPDESNNDFEPVFIDPEEYFMKKNDTEDPKESNEDFEMVLVENDQPIVSQECIKPIEIETQPANLQKEPDETPQEPDRAKSPFDFSDLSSDDGIEDAFEFCLPYRGSTKSDDGPVQPRKEKKKKNEPKPSEPKTPKEPSLLAEILADPNRLPGGFRKGRFSLRRCNGVPYCKYCDSIFMSFKESQEHRKTCENLQCDANKYICRICKEVRSKNNFNGHNHFTKCFYCDKHVWNPLGKREISAHIKKHHKGQPYEHPRLVYPEGYAEQLFKREGHLYDERVRRYAMWKEKNEPKGRFTCDVCNKIFKTIGVLEHHKKLHTDCEKYPCEYCGKIFFNPANVRMHLFALHKDKVGERKKRKLLNKNGPPTNDEETHEQQNKAAKSVEELDEIVATLVDENNSNKSEVRKSQQSERQKIDKQNKVRDKTTEIDSSKRFMKKTSETTSEESSSDDDELLIPKEATRRSARARKPAKKFIEEKVDSSRDSSPSAPSLQEDFNDFSDDDDYDPNDDFEVVYEDITKEAKDIKKSVTQSVVEMDSVIFDDQSSAAFEDESKTLITMNENRNVCSTAANNSKFDKMEKIYVKTSVAGTSILPGNFKPGRFKIRNCNGLPYCKFCDTLFLNRKEKAAHECEFLKCDPQKYICRICKKVLSKTTFSHHTHVSFICQYCGLKISHQRELYIHIRNKHAYEEYKPFLSFEEKDVENYFKEKISQEGHIYEMREKASKIKMQRELNKKPIAEEDLYICDYCGHQTQYKWQIKLHLPRHFSRHYQCVKCIQTFESIDVLREHRKIHDIQRQHYECDYCGRKFKNRGGIRAHQRKIHGFRLKCETCSIQVSKSELEAHMREAHGELHCEFCEKVFLIPSSLRNHEIRHKFKAKVIVNSKTYNCQFCDEIFRTQALLNYHLRFHDACEYITCDICGKTFLTLSMLNDHQKKKHQIGLYCEICKMSVKDKAELKAHMPTHGTFECDTCHKTFEAPSKLKAHMRYHSIDEYKKNHIECNFCPKTVLPKTMRNHVFKFHKDKYEEWFSQNNP